MITLKQLREDRENIDKNSTSKKNDLPFVVVLKRKSLRRFPDGTLVGLYYSDKLNRTIAIPLSDFTTIDGGHI